LHLLNSSLTIIFVVVVAGQPNKGLRLDYFVCDPTLFDEKNQVVVRDSYMDFDQMGSDHCPVILELEIKKKAAK